MFIQIGHLNKFFLGQEQINVNLRQAQPVSHRGHYGVLEDKIMLLFRIFQPAIE